MNLYINKFLNKEFRKERELDELYLSMGLSYPKFYKMDSFTKMGFLSAEQVLGAVEDKDKTALVFFSNSGSFVADSAYFRTIRDADAFFPSPSLFVYTLPNIVEGEIAIRHHCVQETSCYVIKEPDSRLFIQVLEETFDDNPELKHILFAWLDFKLSGMIVMVLVSKEGNILLTENKIKELIDIKY